MARSLPDEHYWSVLPGRGARRPPRVQVRRRLFTYARRKPGVAFRRRRPDVQQRDRPVAERDLIWHALFLQERARHPRHLRAGLRVVESADRDGRTALGTSQRLSPRTEQPAEPVLPEPAAHLAQG